jgi:hypothetical protein
MKIIFSPMFLACGLIAASAPSLLAQPAERPDREAVRKQDLELFDKNKDGELDEGEREAAREFRVIALEPGPKIFVAWL